MQQLLFVYFFSQNPGEAVMATKESKLDIELATMIVNVKSRILEGIARTLADPEKFADCTKGRVP